MRWIRGGSRAPRGPRLLGAVVTVAATSTGLVACGGDEAPEVAPPTTASVSSSATSTPSLAEPPVATPIDATKQTDRGAIAFTVHWFAVFNRAVRVESASDLRDISTPGCQTCNRFAEIIDTTARNRGFIETRGWRLEAVQTVIGVDEASGPSLSVRARVPQQKLQPSQGADVALSEASEVLYLAQPRWVGGRWMMSKLIQQDV